MTSISGAAVRADVPAGPVLVERDRCVSCRSASLTELDGGRYGDQPLRGFIEADPWGEDPMPHVENERWSLVRCDECGQAFHRRIFSDAWNEVRFNRWMSADAIAAFLADHDAGEDAPRFVKHVLRIKSAFPKPRVLDFGCGAGKFIEVAGLFGLEAVGVDRAQPRRSSANVRVLPSLDEVEGDFHAISLMEVLEHLDDPLSILEMLEKRLVPDGLFIIEVPDCSGVEKITDRRSYHLLHPMEHINAFTPRTLVNMLSRIGFEPVFKKPAFVTTSPARLAKDVAKSALREKGTQRYFRRKAR